MKEKGGKIAGYIVPALLAVATTVFQIFRDDKAMEAEIDERVNKALAEREKES